MSNEHETNNNEQLASDIENTNNVESTGSHSHSDSHHHSGSHHHSSHHSGSHYHSSSHHHSSHHSSYSQPYGYGSSKSKRKKAKKVAMQYNRKNKHPMKKSNKIKLIIAIIICVLILLSIALYEIYHLVVVPKYIKPALKEVVTVMADEKYSNGITKEIRRLYDLGVISGPVVEEYLERNTITEEQSGPANTPEQTPEQNSDNTPSVDNPTSNNETTTSSLGIASVNVIDENSTSSSSTVQYYSGGSKKKNEDKPSNTVSMAELQTMSMDQIYEKAKSIMSPEDLSVAWNLRTKVDLAKVKSLRSDSKALLKYIQESLTADEYSNMLYIYAKYSNHLTK